MNAATENSVKNLHRLSHARLPITVGFAALLFLVGGLGVWSVTTELAGAVIASGQIQVESNRQVVQHPEGGVVGEIVAQNGHIVGAGDILVRFDDTLLLSELAIVEGQLSETRAQRARLNAERDGALTIDFPEDLQELSRSNPTAAAQMAGQQRLFDARKLTLDQKIKQLVEQQSQSNFEVEGLSAQLLAYTDQYELVGAEVTRQRRLMENGLTRSATLTASLREDVQLKGQIASTQASIARVRGRIAGLELEVMQLVATRREAAILQLQELQAKEHELLQQRISLSDRISRLDVRAPTSGVIYDSKVFAERSVIQPAEPMMYVIPQDRPLVVAARVRAGDVDQVSIGQAASLRFSTLDQRRTPQLEGRVIKLSADAFSDNSTGLSFYGVEILPNEGELNKLIGSGALPGMPVEAFIKTDARTPLSYFVKPLVDYFSRSMRG